MLEAAERTTDPSVLTPPVCLSSLPPFPCSSLPCRATNQPLWEPSTAPTSRAWLEPPLPPPPSIPAQRHLPFTSTSHCPSLCSQPTPQKPVSLAVWLQCSAQDCTTWQIIPPTDQRQPVARIWRCFTPLFMTGGWGGGVRHYHKKSWVKTCKLKKRQFKKTKTKTMWLPKHVPPDSGTVSFPQLLSDCINNELLVCHWQSRYSAQVLPLLSSYAMLLLYVMCCEFLWFWTPHSRFC